jgi:hypothetical protein
MRPVELGPLVGRLRIVESGLEAGERVAIEGLLMLRDGATITPKLVDFSKDAPKAADAGS